MKKQSKTKYKMFGRIRECRNEKKMTLPVLAEAIGRTENHLGGIERGERNAVKLIPKIAEALDVRPEYLLEIDDFKTEEDVRAASKRKQLHHDVDPEQAFSDYLQALGLCERFEHSDGDIRHRPDVLVISKDGKDLSRVPIEKYDDCVDELFQIAQIKIKKMIAEKG